MSDTYSEFMMAVLQFNRELRGKISTEDATTRLYSVVDKARSFQAFPFVDSMALITAVEHFLDPGKPPLSISVIAEPDRLDRALLQALASLWEIYIGLAVFNDRTRVDEEVGSLMDAVVRRLLPLVQEAKKRHV